MHQRIINQIKGNTKRKKRRRRKVKIPEKRMKEMLNKESENLKLKRGAKRVILKEKGITLIALVVTIIILLILVGVTLNIALSDNGLFERAKGGTEKYKKAQTNEEELISSLETEMSKYGGENPPTVTPTPSDGTPETVKEAKEREYEFEKTTPVEDEYGNKVVIPGKFKVVEGTTVQEGIVIEDSDGNQFVWIPVSNVNGNNEKDGSENENADDLITLDNGTKVEITLGRYTFETGTGKETLKQKGSDYEKEEVIEYYSKEVPTDARTDGGKGAKDLKSFVDSVRDNHGYYIARYEAGEGTDKKTPVSKAGQVWNNITQEQASTAAQGMYREGDVETDFIESDLINSYAYDTAIVYIQAMGNSNYANRCSEDDSLQNTGALNDERCHIHDMAGNVCEYTTEYSTRDDGEGFVYPCVVRGGSFYWKIMTAGARDQSSGTGGTDDLGFRPILYLK